ncbi:phosphatidylethanolamine-binding protein [candidate division TA06 bacterium DG_24]|uniref:Phosphatidylethanolamine-binding protein n=3 Tax=Bacteria division TA06 TaxID=1156500 RepID=A0A0S8J918_UNCT6|nr:MAG: phosphatidylethanolamine-binding protein [candidate division TA06 bacterium DG_24]KPK67693.1 MAG: phosphatidylethanolamine-binding protein [candidate division TA06 bacterium SM23_40]KPL05810.1 MAG: phosphatidylethanolamine-binding protein [candidate division TA06 bacterium SM1_40]
MIKRVSVLLLAMTLLMACQTENQTQEEEKGEIAMAITLQSSAFEEGGTIPARHTCEGDDVSPPLSWGDVPEGTKSIALICDDPDAPRGTWVHWVIYGLAPDMRELAEGIPAEKALSEGGSQGTNDFRRIGYGGPCPPKGPAHRYFFKLYALDAEIGLEAGASKSDLLDAMEGHILAQGQLMGMYQR